MQKIKINDLWHLCTIYEWFLELKNKYIRCKFEKVSSTIQFEPITRKKLLTTIQTRTTSFNTSILCLVIAFLINIFVEKQQIYSIELLCQQIPNVFPIKMEIGYFQQNLIHQILIEHPQYISINVCTYVLLLPCSHVDLLFW